MRRMTLLVMALALALGFTQCKKEVVEPNGQEGHTIRITLAVNGGNNGSKVDVNTGTGAVSFENGDKVYVGYGGAKIGTLQYNGEQFSGEVSEVSYDGVQPLHFYFLGGLEFNPTIDETNNTATVNISDQTKKLPVISYAPSEKPFTGAGSYSAKLMNKASLMKFNVTTPSTAAICITGMNNKVSVDFKSPNGTDNGFSYSQTDGGLIKMAGKDEHNATWAVVLPQAALEETGDAFSEDNEYFGTRPALSAIGSNQYLSSGVSMTVNIPAWDGDLSKLTEGVSERYATATNDMTISGTLTADVKVSIADGATVTLDGANINNGSKSRSVSCAGITCVGSATINLYGGSINNINSNSDGYPGIQAGPSGNTLTIQGAGSLSAQGGSNAPGIGGGNEITCGNISLLGGTISACGGNGAAGIGSGSNGSCGNIEIEGGEITAQGGEGAAGIGSGSSTNAVAVCGNIHLYGGIINACGGEGAAGIGSGSNGSCGNIEIEGGEITAQGGEGAAGIGSGSSSTNAVAVCGNIHLYGGIINACGGAGAAGIGSGQGGSCGDIEIDVEVTATAGPGAPNSIGAGQNGSCVSVTLPIPEGALSGLFSVSDDKQVRFSRGNLLSNGTFAANQYTYGDLISSNDGYSGPTDNWYALTLDEWRYLYQHSTCGFATVDGIHGLIILPDNYSGSDIIPYDSQNANHELWNDNTYTVSEWTEMENNGVVFLPAYFQDQNFEGYYLSSSSNFVSVGLFMFLCEKGSIDLNTGTQNWDTDITDTYGTLFHGYSVRLVKTNTD